MLNQKQDMVIFNLEEAAFSLQLKRQGSRWRWKEELVHQTPCQSPIHAQPLLLMISCKPATKCKNLSYKGTRSLHPWNSKQRNQQTKNFQNGMDLHSG